MHPKFREGKHTSSGTHGTGVGLNVADFVVGASLHGAVVNAVVKVLACTQALQVVGFAAQRVRKTQHVVVAHFLSTSIALATTAQNSALGESLQHSQRYSYPQQQSPRRKQRREGRRSSS